MKKIYIMSALAVCLFSATACSDFLDREPDKIMTDDQIFGDAVMICFSELLWSRNMGTTHK